MVLSCSNKTDCHDIAEILLKVALYTINLSSEVMIQFYHQQETFYLLNYLDELIALGL
jgi:hypothetical protein